MKNFLGIAVLVALLSSCMGEITLPKPPADLISKEQMIPILKDLTVMEVFVQQRYQNVNVYYKIITKSGAALLKKKGISVDRFERSYNYYVSRQTEMQEMYSEVMDQLTEEVNKLQTQ